MTGYELQINYGSTGTTVVPPFDDVRDALLCALSMPKVSGYGQKIQSVTIRFHSDDAAGDESK